MVGGKDVRVEVQFSDNGSVLRIRGLELVVDNSNDIAPQGVILEEPHQEGWYEHKVERCQ